MRKVPTKNTFSNKSLENNGNKSELTNENKKKRN